MKRVLRKIAVVASSMAVVVTAVMWVRSYCVGDELMLVDHAFDPPGDHGDLSRRYEARSAGGVLAVAVSDQEDRQDVDPDQSASDDPGESRPRWEFFHFDVDLTPPEWEVSTWGNWRYGWLGFAVGSEAYRGAKGESNVVYVAAPYWAISVVPGLASWGILWPAVRAWRRRRAGLCERCAYDLRETPERCPECGAISRATVAGDQGRGSESSATAGGLRKKRD